MYIYIYVYVYTLFACYLQYSKATTSHLCALLPHQNCHYGPIPAMLLPITETNYSNIAWY